jgi:hypothetical protein
MFNMEHADETHIVCPKCSHQIPLTESIAAPLLKAERRDFQQKLAVREAEFARQAEQLMRPSTWSMASKNPSRNPAQGTRAGGQDPRA